jgi:AhpD family alkylhydroperoxidase
MSHAPRIDYRRLSPAAFKAYLEFDRAAAASGLEPSLLELIKLRASQINGCAYCLDMHSKDARAQGETEQRLYTLPVWREAPFFSERERAALAWTEALTGVATNGISDELFAATRAHFSEQEVVALALAVVAINGWNRFAVAFRPVPGTYQPPTRTRSERPDVA